MSKGSSSAKKRSGKPAIDVLEEAVRLLRHAPALALLMHLVGAVPCMLGLLYFLTDMSHNPFAAERLVGSSLGMAGLWLWMKCWHAAFAAHLRSELLLEPPPTWTIRRILRLVTAQVALQPTGLILRPVAMQLLIPYVWVATFYLNVTVLGDGERPGLRELVMRSLEQAKLWPKQQHALAALLTIFSIFVWLNILVAVIAVPFGMKTFFGVETVFTKNFMGFFNLTFLYATFALAYVVLDPVRKAMIVVRCFYGSSLRSGEDLMLQLKAVRRSSGPAALVASLLFLVSPLGVSTGRAELAQPVNSAELNRSIDEVLEGREYAWRAPRETKPEAKNDTSWFGKLKKDVSAWVEKVVHRIARSVGRTFKKAIDWMFGDKETTSSRGDLLSWLNSVRYVFYALLVVSTVVLVFLIVRARRRRPAVQAARPVAPRPDLTEENVTADRLPEEGWLQLARELIESGELRLALRASYLAGLAHLGQRELIRLAWHKSNRDYDRELRRRARTQQELLAAFDDNLEAFERSWYGEHTVTHETLGHFTQNLERIRAC